MWQLTKKRISLRIWSVLSKVEPGAGAGPLHRIRPKSTGSGSATLTTAVVGFGNLLNCLIEKLNTQ